MRYKKNTNFFNYHVNALLNLPLIKNRFSMLKEFIDDAKNHLLALEKLNESIQMEYYVNYFKKIKLDNIK